MESATSQAAAEAAAFNARIRERLAAGFIPDLRRAKKCEYFYQSFWRDPHFIDLFLGQQVREFIALLHAHGGPGLRVLDAGCGPGYVALELARAGFRVTGVDVADEAIAAARQTLAENTLTDGFGSLTYVVGPFVEVQGEFDAVLFRGVVHHFPNPNPVLAHAASLLSAGGLMLCMEPGPEPWRAQDAAQAALIRGLLAATGHWHDPALIERLRSPAAIGEYTAEVQREFVEERGADEPPQSPHDHACGGAEILAAARAHFQELELRPTNAFLHRLLGGLRGSDEIIHPLADFIAHYERHAIDAGYLRAIGFLFVGRKAG